MSVSQFSPIDRTMRISSRCINPVAPAKQPDVYILESHMLQAFFFVVVVGSFSNLEMFQVKLCCIQSSLFNCQEPRDFKCAQHILGSFKLFHPCLSRLDIQFTTPVSGVWVCVRKKGRGCVVCMKVLNLFRKLYNNYGYDWRSYTMNMCDRWFT